MLLVVYPHSSNRAAIRVLVNSIPVLLIVLPLPSEFSTIAPFHHTEAVYCIFEICASKLLAILWPDVKTKSLYIIFSPIAFVDCTIRPFHGTEASMHSVFELSLVIIALRVFLLPEAILFVKLEITNNNE